MTRAPPENITVTEADIGPGTGTLLLLGSTVFSPFSPATSASIGGHKYPPSQRRLNHHRECLALPMGPGLFFQCIWKWLRNRTRRWPKTGKQTLKEYSSL